MAMVACGFYHTIVLTGDLIDRDNYEGNTSGSANCINVLKRGNSMPQSAHGLLELPQYKLPNGDLVNTRHGYAGGVKNLQPWQRL